MPFASTSNVTSICGMPRGARDARQHKSAHRLIVAAEFAFALQNVDFHARLVIRRRREHLTLFNGNGRIAFDNAREHAPERFDAERERHNVEQQHVFHFARKHAALDRGADCDAFVGVNPLEGFLARNLLDFFHDGGNARRSADENDFVDIVIRKSGVLHGKTHRLRRLFHKIGNERLEFLARDLDFEVRGTGVRHRNEGQRNGRGIHARKLDLGFFRRFLQALHRHFVFGKINAVALFEFLNHIIHNAFIEVVAAQTVVAVRGKHFKHAVGNFQNGNVERAAAQVVNHDFAVFLVFIESVRKRGSRRLVDDAQYVQSCDLARVLRRLTLRVGEIRGAGDHGVRDLAADIRFRVLFELGEDHRRDLLRRIRLFVDLHFIVAPHFALDRNDRFIGIGDRLTLCHLPDDTRTVFLKADDRRGRTRAFRVGDNDGLAAFHHRNARICRSQIDTDYLSHTIFSPFFAIYLITTTCANRSTLPSRIYPFKYTSETVPLSPSPSIAMIASLVSGSNASPTGLISVIFSSSKSL